MSDRLHDLTQRLIAWSFSGDQLSEVFADACRRLEQSLVDVEDPDQVQDDLLLNAFEAALDDFDVILENFPQEYDK